MKFAVFCVLLFSCAFAMYIHFDSKDVVVENSPPAVEQVVDAGEDPDYKYINGRKVLPGLEDHNHDTLAQGGRTDKNGHPEWDADVIVYKLHDDRNTTSDRWITEWTPEFDHNKRCMMYANGGTGCYDKPKPETPND